MKRILKIIVPFIVIVTPASADYHDKWIIVTTIQYPTPALIKLAQQKDWQLLVVGDKKTPKDWYLDEKCIYLTPEDQEELPYELVKLLPWNHYARKNIGYLYAIDHGAKIIYETDDDNYVVDSIKIFKDDPDIVTLLSSQPVINVYAYFGKSSIWPRGYPLSYIQHGTDFDVSYSTYHQNILIEQGVIDNDPDVDALFRLTRTDNTHIFFDKDKPACVLSKKIFSPFNTQSTLFHKDAFWGLYIPSYVPFRVCDIWRGYITQRLLWEIDGSLCFTPSIAFQDRNMHDFMKDFIDEQELYLKSHELINFLLNWDYMPAEIIQNNLSRLYDDVIKAGFVGADEAHLLKAWIKDLRNMQVL